MLKLLDKRRIFRSHIFEDYYNLNGALGSVGVDFLDSPVSVSEALDDLRANLVPGVNEETGVDDPDGVRAL